MNTLMSSYTPGLVALVVIVSSATLLAIYLCAEEVYASRREYTAENMHSLYSERMSDDDTDDYDDEYLEDDGYEYAPVDAQSAMNNTRAYAALSQQSGEFFKVADDEYMNVPEFVPAAWGTATVLPPAYAAQPQLELAATSYSTAYVPPNPHYTGRHRTDEVSGTAAQRLRGYCAPAAVVRPRVPVIPGLRRELVGGRA
jgi:hypothetical protein